MPLWRGLGDPERDFVIRMAPLNRTSAARLLSRLRVSNTWRQMDVHGFDHVTQTLVPEFGRHEFKRKFGGAGRMLGVKSGLVSADRIDLTPEVSMIVRFSLAGFEADSDPDASEVDHAVLAMVWSNGKATYWGDEPAILDLLADAPVRVSG